MITAFVSLFLIGFALLFVLSLISAVPIWLLMNNIILPELGLPEFSFWFYWAALIVVGGFRLGGQAKVEMKK
jgi:hypothetical protein